MPLSGTGPIKMSQIKTELGSTSNSLRAYSAAAGKSAPDVMSEFFGYSSATTAAPTTAAPTTAAPTTAAPTTAAPTTAAPTTQPVMTELTIGWSSTSGADACTQKAGGGNYTIKLLGAGASLTNGIIIYVSYYPQTAAAGYYSDGTNYWYFDGTNVTGAATACPVPTTTSTTTTTTTTTTTLGPWTIARLSVVDAYEACNGTADMTSISVSGGTNIRNASVITFLSQTGTFENLVGNGESFWINQKVGPTFYSRKYTRTANNQGTAAEASVECDVPITTAAPTTAAPTTAAPTTAAPTTAAPTTAAPTTAAPTTAAPTTYTVNIWGRKSFLPPVLLYYGVNDVSCPNGGNTLSTTGALKHTIQVAYGGVVYVRCTDVDDAAVAFNAQVATNTYGVATCPNPHYTAFTITENTDISVIGDGRTSC